MFTWSKSRKIPFTIWTLYQTDHEGHVFGVRVEVSDSEMKKRGRDYAAQKLRSARKILKAKSVLFH
jgi:hypothetical protein